MFEVYTLFKFLALIDYVKLPLIVLPKGTYYNNEKCLWFKCEIETCISKTEYGAHK